MAALPLPPSARSREAFRLTAAAAIGRFELQVCRNCGAVQYPPREACHRCLSSALDWRLQPGGAELLAITTLRHSHDEFFRARLPIRLGLVRLDVGPTAVVYLAEGIAAPPARVRVSVRLDKSGRGVLVALPEVSLREGQSSRNGYLREMTCDPRGRRMLVADAGSALGVALVRALVDVGADVVWAGYSPAVAERSGLEDVPGGFEQVRVVSLDVTSDESVNVLAGQIGSQVDVLINNVDALPGTDLTSPSTETDTLVRLARAFAPAMQATSRAAPVSSPLLAWVNLLSFSGRTASCGASSSARRASNAAAYSFSQSLRAQMRPAGIRVVDVFPGPQEPVALARAIVEALQEGIEDLYPGELAQDWLARWCNNPEVPELGPAADR
jgi:NAD(P)-dependent dehydrogenase (short-subunit alcohol dehydrogenase family)/uncharacterized OB-fold protein